MCPVISPSCRPIRLETFLASAKKSGMRDTRAPTTFVLLVACFHLMLVMLPDRVVAADWAEIGPVISMGSTPLPYMVWNDPSVLNDGSDFRMWLSGGDARDLTNIRVDVYQARSADGRSWTLSQQPVLSPGTNADDWDNLRTETPSVVKVGGTYHMYYSGFSQQGAKTGESQIGHATSVDGTNWVKDLGNPILTGQNRDPHRWGYGGVGEPGVIYNANEGTFYLYYTGLRYSPGNPTIGQIGILLATSKDGSYFSPVLDASGQSKLILFQDVPGAIDGAWFGYSTASAFIDSYGRYQLFAAVVIAPEGPSTPQHICLTRAVSTNGVDFTLAEIGIVPAGQGDWKDHQVRAPSALELNGQVLMWFAGEALDPYRAAIGLVSHPMF
jgi:hypothetical protein